VIFIFKLDKNEVKGIIIFLVFSLIVMGVYVFIGSLDTMFLIVGSFPFQDVTSYNPSTQILTIEVIDRFVIHNSPEWFEIDLTKCFQNKNIGFKVCPKDIESWTLIEANAFCSDSNWTSTPNFRVDPSTNNGIIAVYVDPAIINVPVGSQTFITMEMVYQNLQPTTTTTTTTIPGQTTTTTYTTTTITIPIIPVLPVRNDDLIFIGIVVIITILILFFGMKLVKK